MKIQVNGRTVNFARSVKIGTEGENGVTEVTFVELPIIGDGQLVTINWLTDGDEPIGDIEALEANADGYAFMVEQDLTQFAGRTVTAYLEITSGDKIWRSEPFLLDATDLPKVEQTLEPKDPTIISQIKDAIAKAYAAAAHSPKIGENRNWYYYDANANAYVDSGIPSHGEDGISPSVSVSEITGGHRVTITDAEGAKVFDVMNGTDGEGTGGGITEDEYEVIADWNAPADWGTNIYAWNELAHKKLIIIVDATAGTADSTLEFVWSYKSLCYALKGTRNGSKSKTVCIIDTYIVNDGETKKRYLKAACSEYGYESDTAQYNWVTRG